MSDANILRLHKWFSFLAKGNFTEQDFNQEFGPGEEDGRMFMGKMSSDRRELIKADASRNVAEIERKHARLFEKPETEKTKKSK